MRKVINVIFLIYIVFFANLFIVYANDIKSINMNIYIDEYGDAIVNESWNAYLDEGTEGYKTFSKMSNAFITDFIVTDDTGTTYTFIDWNSNLSFIEKSYKNGIMDVNNGVELCWGISNYGERTYSLTYKINNFVNQFTDKQGIYFKLLNLDQKVDYVNINISSYIPLSLDNSRIWGFGYNGDINFSNGKIKMGVGKLSDTEYVTLLIRFDTNLYNTDNYRYVSFDDVYDEAMKEEQNNSDSIIYPFIIFVISFILVFLIRFILSIILVLTKNFFERILPNNNLEFKESIKKLSKMEVNYYRDIPCEKDIESAYFILNKLNIIKTKKIKKGIISAFILKWLKYDYLSVYKNCLVINKDFVLKLESGEVTFGSYNEKILFSILIDACNEDFLLEPNEFKRWSKKNYKKLNRWFCDILEEKKEYYVNNKNIITVSKNKFGTTYIFKVFDDYLINQAVRLKGLKKFLLDFSNIKDKGVIEVELWEYYLIFANLFGIAKKVDNELKNLYPNFNEINIFDIIDEFSESTYRGMMTSINLENFKEDIKENYKNFDRYSGSDRNTGGGGKSFSSGGSSAGGSSGGGFR